MKKTHYKQVVDTLAELHTQFPSYNMGRHISTALSDYGDVWGISDKELLFALEKYQAELSLDLSNIAPDDYVDRIVKDGLNLFEQEEEEEEDY